MSQAKTENLEGKKQPKDKVLGLDIPETSGTQTSGYPWSGPGMSRTKTLSKAPLSVILDREWPGCPAIWVGRPGIRVGAPGLWSLEGGHPDLFSVCSNLFVLFFVFFDLF